ncbi:MAG: N-acetylmuramoyl-L-alanine amidase [Thermotogae bacterium]|nr:N-acetylmuramoyl-L-alanine amidase [Thermotogota bacterium]
MIILLGVLDSVLVVGVKEVERFGDTLLLKGKISLDTSALDGLVDGVRRDHERTLLLLNRRFAYHVVKGDTLVLYSKEGFIVVVDPGHGGTDFGAVGVRGLAEKDVTLQVALRLVEELRWRGYRVVLTREEDRFVSLFERGELANALRGRYKVYVSLHCNFMSNSKAKGLETYILTLEKATDRRAAVLVENMPYVTSKEVKGIIGDLLQNVFLEDSRTLALFVHSNLKRYTTDRGVRQANFYVLRQIFFPSILVELGYLSNPYEANLLKDPSYQEALAKDIAEGIDKFFTWKFGQ